MDTFAQRPNHREPAPPLSALLERHQHTLGIHRKTVKKHIETDAFPQYHKRKRGISILDPYKQIINDYLDQDDYQGTWIFDRLKRSGYPAVTTLSSITLPISKSRRPGWHISVLRRSRDYKPRLTSVGSILQIEPQH